MSFSEISFHVFYNFWKLKWQDVVISSPLRLMFCEFSLRGNKSHLSYNELFCCHFLVFVFSTHSKEIIIVTEFMFAGINWFWAQIIFIPANIYSIVFIQSILSPCSSSRHSSRSNHCFSNCWACTLFLLISARTKILFVAFWKKIGKFNAKEKGARKLKTLNLIFYDNCRNSRALIG